MIALTFDDGPSDWTEPLLDVLARHKAQATFFVLGASIRGREETLRRATDEGHELGNHGYSHAPMTDLTDDEVEDELERTTELIETATPATVRFWRAPHLNIDNRVRGVGDEIGLTHVGIDVAPADWRSTETEIVVDIRVGARVGSIIGLHDGAPPWKQGESRAATVAAVDRILDRLEGPFVTVADLC